MLADPLRQLGVAAGSSRSVPAEPATSRKQHSFVPTSSTARSHESRWDYFSEPPRGQDTRPFVSRVSAHTATELVTVGPVSAAAGLTP